LDVVDSKAGGTEGALEVRVINNRRGSDWVIEDDLGSVDEEIVDVVI
jgi:hypothetical protein